jgi:Ca2+-binding RTX toxin-like protein
MALLTGTAGPDFLRGTAGDDDLQGLDGNDNLTDALGGNDRLSGGPGNDNLTVERSSGASNVTLDGGDGDDFITINGGALLGGGQIAATASGGAGNDYFQLFGGNVSGLIDGGAGNDTVSLWPIHEALTVRLGPGGADRITMQMNVDGDLKAPVVVEDFQPGDGGDVFEMLVNLFSFTGYDFSNPFGAGGYLRLVQSGADAVLQVDKDGGGDGFRDLARFVGVQAAQFTAANFAGFPPSGAAPAGRVITGSTIFLNGSGNENLTGGIGPDTINGQVLNDHIEAGPGNDLIDGGTGDDFINTDYGDDTASGGEGNDTLQGGQRDLLRGGAGNDVLNGGSPFDPVARFTLEGGAGDDRLSVTVVGARQGGAAFGGDGTDTLSAAGDGAVSLDGGAGDDLVLLGGFNGPVTVTLGAGQDAVYLNKLNGVPSSVVITDFTGGAGGDRIRRLRRGWCGWRRRAARRWCSCCMKGSGATP